MHFQTLATPNRLQPLFKYFAGPKQPETHMNLKQPESVGCPGLSRAILPEVGREVDQHEIYELPHSHC